MKWCGAEFSAAFAMMEISMGAEDALMIIVVVLVVVIATIAGSED